MMCRETLCVNVTKKFEWHYHCDVLLLYLKTIYLLKQAVREFLSLITLALNDTCLYFFGQWNGWSYGLHGSSTTWIQAKIKEIADKRFDCDTIGKLNEYVGCIFDHNDNFFKYAKPILLKSHEDKFKSKREKVIVPAIAIEVL